MFDDLAGNIQIYYANLTWFYTFSMIISCLAVGINFWGRSFFDIKQKAVENSEHDAKMGSEAERCSLQTQYKLAKQKLAEKHLTPEQRSIEKEAEAQQLAAILKLLQEQSDTFQVSSMEQLEDQLRLYRN
ncbi:uncharacterized protein LOC124301663 isoform X1 [Neodiprion virginianus]|uniref:Uncharacterized protein LOC107227759 isoform X1 n=1 Tax=Neodiprion lecontei TaxID=441921 RepID=A0A6J0CCZ4_NEOLC|nr:uncharacterized protein LOC107227759 isoform X1 [Neodiprion lecontei]XP_046419415.1 uncharacterized protein LOC124179238 isoform X1 [Neodiprion fabricii]XP_046612976.1 uncharacterized protein LOC124301663 isoform X1 [Neodiprion virginianus]